MSQPKVDIVLQDEAKWLVLIRHYTADLGIKLHLRIASNNLSIRNHAHITG